ncbi:spindle assembly checkpoint component Mad1 [Dipodascopsis uninucleata]
MATPLRGLSAPNGSTGNSSIPVRRSASMFTPASAAGTGAPKVAHDPVIYDSSSVSRQIFQSIPPNTDSSKKNESNNIVDSLRAANHALKYELSNMTDERERDKLRYENRIRELEQKVKEEGLRADSIESDQQFLFNRYKEIEEELTKSKEEFSNEKSGLELSVRSMRQELQEATERLEETESELRTAKSSINLVRNEFVLKEKTLQSTVQDLTDQLTVLSRSVQDKAFSLNEKEELIEALQAENKSLKLKSKDIEELDAAKRQLSDQIAYSKSVENKLHVMIPELKQLREEHEKFKFVAEEKILLEARLKLMEDLRRQIADAELEVATMKEERARWAAFLNSTDHFDTPEDVIRALTEERSEKLSLLDKVGRLEAEMAARSSGMQGDQEEILKIESQVKQLQETIDKNTKLFHRMERQKNLAVKEAQFLREQLKTYDNEETVYMQDNYDKQKAGRIENLENLLEEAKQEIAKLTSELQERERTRASTDSQSLLGSRKRSADDTEDENVGNLLRRNRQLQDECTALIRKEENAQRDISALEKQIRALEESKIAQVRVLEFRDNPAARDQAVKKQMLDTLQQENNALLAQLEDRRQDIGRVVPISTLDRLKLEMKDMEVSIADKEKRVKRLKEIWSAKSMEFREAVYSLLGYKLDFLPNNKVRATSMFASSEEESFTFDPEAGTMKLSGRTDSPFAKECSNLITFWVQERREIPCFLAALNLELYDRTTKAARF